jgi:hypothetical protein
MTIHRFKFSDELNIEIQKFSNLHIYDNNEDFKESFDKWCESPFIKDLIDTENEFLYRYQYKTDITTKIYRSIKYYYVKKFSLNNNKEPKKRERKYDLDPDILLYIKKHISEQFDINPNFKPSTSYIDFCKSNSDFDNNYIKKCYKNQYYQIKNIRYSINAT